MVGSLADGFVTKAQPIRHMPGANALLQPAVTSVFEISRTLF